MSLWLIRSDVLFVVTVLLIPLKRTRERVLCVIPFKVRGLLMRWSRILVLFLAVLQVRTECWPLWVGNGLLRILFLLSRQAIVTLCKSVRRIAVTALGVQVLGLRK